VSWQTHAANGDQHALSGGGTAGDTGRKDIERCHHEGTNDGDDYQSLRLHHRIDLANSTMYLQWTLKFLVEWHRELIFQANSMGFIDVSQAGYTLPWYKAFSPEGLRLAVSSVVVSGATFTYTNQLDPQDNSLASGFTDTPSLSVYNVNGTAPILVAVGAGNPDIHAGDGVDWAPNLDLLAWPVTTNITFGGFYGGNGSVTAIYVMMPVADSMGTGHVLPLTFPQGSSGLLPNLMGTYVEWQTDYSPAFSHNGKQVAYIRGDSITASTISGYVTQRRCGSSMWTPATTRSPTSTLEFILRI
jgi:hypothetical protein